MKGHDGRTRAVKTTLGRHDLKQRGTLDVADASSIAVFEDAEAPLGGPVVVAYDAARPGVIALVLTDRHPLFIAAVALMSGGAHGGDDDEPESEVPALDAEASFERSFDAAEPA